MKLGSTGYRFLRYYTGSPAFVRRGRPHPALRLLAPLLIASTLAPVGSDIGLLITGPTHGEGPLLALHVLSFLVWLAAVALHVSAHVRPVPALLATDWQRRTTSRIMGRSRRLALVSGSLVAGAAAGVALSHLIAGAAVAAVALVAARPLRWQ